MIISDVGALLTPPTAQSNALKAWTRYRVIDEAQQPFFAVIGMVQSGVFPPPIASIHGDAELSWPADAVKAAIASWRRNGGPQGQANGRPILSEPPSAPAPPPEHRERARLSPDKEAQLEMVIAVRQRRARLRMRAGGAVTRPRKRKLLRRRD